MSLVFYACRKSETANSSPSKPERQQELVDRLTAIYGKQPSIVNIPMNIDGVVELVDKDGVAITHNRLYGRGTDGTGTNSSPFCVDHRDPDDQGQSITLSSVDIIYDCGAATTSFRPHFRVRTAFNLLTQSAANPFPYSYGRFRIRNSSNTVVYTGPNLSPVTISSPVTDPTNPDRFEYMVSYTTAAYSNSTLNLGTKYEYRIQVYTDCNLQPVAVGTEISTTAKAGEDATPCNKIDNPYLNYVSASYPANVVGCDLTYCYSTFSSARPDGHELQWRAVGEDDKKWKFTRWPDYFNSSAWVGDPFVGTQGALFSVEHKDIYPTNLYTNVVSDIPLTTGVPRTTFPADYIEFRFRNVMYDRSFYPSRFNVCIGPWSIAQSVKVQ